VFRKMPVVLLICILAAATLSPYLSEYCQSLLYGLSLSLKSLIVFLLPLLVFSLLCKTASELAQSASKWVVLVLGALCASNFLSTLLSYTVGSFAGALPLSIGLPDVKDSLHPVGELLLPKWIDNSYAMFSGLVAGTFLGLVRPSLAKHVSRWLDGGVKVCLKMFLFLIPMFIIGFVVKMRHEGMIELILRDYFLVFALVAGSVFAYVFFLYALAGCFRKKTFMASVKNMLPAAMAGFGSMSSAASMPLTLLGVEKSAKNPSLAKSTIPITVNIHLIGDCFAIPIFALTILKSFGMPDPSFMQYLVFAFYFVLAKFSVAAVPGGGILVMIPILESYLGFSGEMASLITALYILFDPVITVANILGNGAFALNLGRVFRREKVSNNSSTETAKSQELLG